jgi:hypothetical protein
VVDWHGGGGKGNYPVDREAGDQFREIFPEIVDVARSSREFLTRAVGYLAGGAGQFLDVGAGLPTAENTHRAAPSPTSSAALSRSAPSSPAWSW